jgi:hypothetical protein
MTSSSVLPARIPVARKSILLPGTDFPMLNAARFLKATGREDVIIAGAIVIRTIMETLGEQECLVSDLGLREGVLIDLAKRITER